MGKMCIQKELGGCVCLRMRNVAEASFFVYSTMVSFLGSRFFSSSQWISLGIPCGMFMFLSHVCVGISGVYHAGQWNGVVVGGLERSF